MILKDFHYPLFFKSYFLKENNISTKKIDEKETLYIMSVIGESSIFKLLKIKSE